VIWGWESFPVGLLAAWSLAWDSVVLVQITEWSVPESLFGTIAFPKESINSEETNTCSF